MDQEYQSSLIFTKNALLLSNAFFIFCTSDVTPDTLYMPTSFIPTTDNEI